LSGNWRLGPIFLAAPKGWDVRKCGPCNLSQNAGETHGFNGKIYGFNGKIYGFNGKIYGLPLGFGGPELSFETSETPLILSCEDFGQFQSHEVCGIQAHYIYKPTFMDGLFTSHFLVKLPYFAHIKTIDISLISHNG